jgi:hypothetical protein
MLTRGLANNNIESAPDAPRPLLLVAKQGLISGSLPRCVTPVDDERRSCHERGCIAEHEQSGAAILFRSGQSLHHVLALPKLFQMRLVFEILLDHLDMGISVGSDGSNAAGRLTGVTMLPGHRTFTLMPLLLHSMARLRPS